VPDFEPVLLAQVGKAESHTLRAYEQAGGYQALREALKEKSPKDVTEIVKASGLRGRGGAGFRPALNGRFCLRIIQGRFISASTRTKASRGRLITVS
jgi:NADH-quinone oxidoreductase subunit F